MKLVRREFGVGFTDNSLLYFLLYSHHLSVSYYVDVVRRNYVLVSQGMFKGLQIGLNRPPDNR